jgi:dihydrofolate synthase/folylpolyglutamate synthase
MVEKKRAFLEKLSMHRDLGVKPGLENITELCGRLGNPHLKVPSIHVAGTNGKGAVCTMIDAALRHAGTKTLLYTSPHLVRINERFRINGKDVADDVLDETLEEVEKASIGINATFFEVLTATAFLLAVRENVDVMVLETGLGGRLDATNIVVPVVSAIVKIGLDHCDWLGDSVEKIALEKAGIIKTSVSIVLGANESSVCGLIESKAREMKAPFFYAPDFTDETEIPLGFSLGGKFNRENALTAISVLKILEEKKISPKIKVSFDGLNSVFWPGRFHAIGRFLVDGAHNPPAAAALVQSLADKMTVIAGFCSDKAVDEFLSIIAPYTNKAFAVKTSNPRSLAPQELVHKMEKCGIKAYPCASLRDAVERASNESQPKRGRPDILICGSLFLAGEALTILSPDFKHDSIDPSEKFRKDY